MRTNNYLPFIGILLSLSILCSCNSERALYKKLESHIDSRFDPDDYKSVFLPIGDVTFDELSPKRYGNIGVQTILFDNLMELDKEGLITCVQKERVGRIFRLEIGLTPKGEEYINGIKTRQGDTYFIPVKAYSLKRGEITNIEYYEKAGTGKCIYSSVYQNVTPFGHILSGAKPGEFHDDGYSFFIYKDEETGEWGPKERY